MQIREIHSRQRLVYTLYLNTFGRAEDGAVAAVSESREALVDFYNSQLLPREERYRDSGGWFRSFREGPLHNFNPCGELSARELSLFGFGIREEWVDEGSIPGIAAHFHVVPEDYRWEG